MVDSPIAAEKFELFLVNYIGILAEDVPKGLGCGLGLRWLAHRQVARLLQGWMGHLSFLRWAC